ncbi:MAG: hypothetical protein LBT51_03295 [Fusobacteriaceae bacterium]|jgi:hypothetical protein|nr:hypothetical protein [Fusobacteriaceae bacterium]
MLKTTKQMQLFKIKTNLPKKRKTGIELRLTDWILHEKFLRENKLGEQKKLFSL